MEVPVSLILPGKSQYLFCKTGTGNQYRLAEEPAQMRGQSSQVSARKNINRKGFFRREGPHARR